MVLTERVFRVGWSDIYAVRIHWPTILRDLHLAGFSSSRIAAMLGTEPSTVKGWLNEDKEPRYSYGAALLVLHAHFCSPQATQKRQTEAKPGQ